MPGPRNTCLLGAALACTALLASAQDTQYPPQNMLIPGPAAAGDFAAWLADLEHWRREPVRCHGYGWECLAVDRRIPG
jgi:hypothetical protein